MTLSSICSASSSDPRVSRIIPLKGFEPRAVRTERSHSETQIPCATDLGEQILGTVNLHLEAKGVRITTGTIVDATLIHAPSSTKNRGKKRDPEMHQTRKGKQWYFGMN